MGAVDSRSLFKYQSSRLPTTLALTGVFDVLLGFVFLLPPVATLVLAYPATRAAPPVWHWYDHYWTFGRSHGIKDQEDSDSRLGLSPGESTHRSQPSLPLGDRNLHIPKCSCPHHH